MLNFQNFPTFETANNRLKFIYTAEGRAVPINDTAFEYQYFIKDHPPSGGQVLGNTRVLLSQTGEVLQQSSYYPFGMLMDGLNTINYSDNENRYLYNGKELQTDFGLDWYDYGAWFYDAGLGRWHVPDPMAEKYTTLSPFAYCANSPVNLVDFNGMTYGEANIENADAQFKDNGWDEMNKEKDNPPEWLNALARLFTGTSGDINAPEEANIPKETRKMSKITGTVNDINEVTEATAEGAKTLAKKTANVMETTEVTLKGTGYFAAPFTDGASLALVPVDEVVEDVGTGINFMIDINDGKTEKALTTAGSRVLFGTTAKSIKSLKSANRLSSSNEGILKFLNEAGNQISNFIQKNVFDIQEQKKEK